MIRIQNKNENSVRMSLWSTVITLPGGLTTPMTPAVFSIFLIACFTTQKISVTWLLQLLLIGQVLSSATMTLHLWAIIFWIFWSLCHLWSQKVPPQLWLLSSWSVEHMFSLASCFYFTKNSWLDNICVSPGSVIFSALVHWQIPAIWDGLDLIFSRKDFSKNISLSPTRNHIVIFPSHNP